ncbi:hypothetical protein CKAN_02787000 [Cinnamomum micranthum f. kanehirae]|uniref:Uncharacterized protein n=1 Tax=Cinnamomum micranthum f. kanehirae TaxID=337451 RepID=A0A3S3RDR6_9MAGN|nr:hypothetical protein CKAN_02787000 [Cinnamomum micranthum f. kanehirae]
MNRVRFELARAGLGLPPSLEEPYEAEAPRTGLVRGGRARRRPGADSPPAGDRRRPSRGTSRPTGNTARPGKATRLESEDHSTCSLPDFIFKFFNAGGTASASVEVAERPPESKGELLHLSPRDTIRYLNRLKESEEAATLPAQPTGKPLISPISRPKKEI